MGTDGDSSASQVSAWGQCGGLSWDGPTPCAVGHTCARQNDHYSQCVPQAAGLLGHIEEEIIVTDGDSSASQVSAWGQCGGLSWDGPTQCAVGYTCERQSDHYAQCVP